MEPEVVLTLYDYHCWATDRLLAACRSAGPEAFLALHPELYSGSLRGALVHSLGAEWIWRSRVQEGISPTAVLDPQDFPSLDAVVERWQIERMKMNAFLNALTPADLQRTVRYHSTKGQPFEETLWRLLLHLINHGTQHRSEVAAVLTQLDCSPGDLDMLLYFRELAE